MKKSIGPKTLVYPTPVFVVGSYGEKDRPNIMTAAWGGICCSSPPCVAVSLRAATLTYGNIMRHKAFTINIPSLEQVKRVDYVGIFSGKETNKFLDTGLTPVPSKLVNAPYVEEFALVLECRVIQTVEIGLHTQFVGEILDVKADEAVFGDGGFPTVEKVRPFMFAPLERKYFSIGDFLGEAFSIGRKL